VLESTMWHLSHRARPGQCSTSSTARRAVSRPS